MPRSRRSGAEEIADEFYAWLKAKGIFEGEEPTDEHFEHLFRAFIRDEIIEEALKMGYHPEPHLDGKTYLVRDQTS
jgi:hypothetical protein